MWERERAWAFHVSWRNTMLVIFFATYVFLYLCCVQFSCFSSSFFSKHLFCFAIHHVTQIQWWINVKAILYFLLSNSGTQKVLVIKFSLLPSGGIYFYVLWRRHNVTANNYLSQSYNSILMQIISHPVVNRGMATNLGKKYTILGHIFPVLKMHIFFSEKNAKAG